MVIFYMVKRQGNLFVVDLNFIGQLGPNDLLLKNDIVRITPTKSQLELGKEFFKDIFSSKEEYVGAEVEGEIYTVRNNVTSMKKVPVMDHSWKHFVLDLLFDLSDFGIFSNSFGKRKTMFVGVRGELIGGGADQVVLKMPILDEFSCDCKVCIVGNQEKVVRNFLGERMNDLPSLSFKGGQTSFEMAKEVKEYWCL